MVGPGSYDHKASTITAQKIKGGKIIAPWHGRLPVHNNGYYYVGEHLVFEPSQKLPSERPAQIDDSCHVDESPIKSPRGRVPAETSGQLSPRTVHTASSDAKRIVLTNSPIAREALTNIRQRLVRTSVAKKRHKQRRKTVDTSLPSTHVVFKKKKYLRIKKLLKRRYQSKNF